MAAESPQPYHVVFMPHVLKRLKTISKYAVQVEKDKDLAGVLRTINAKLSSDPHAWGDRYWSVKATGTMFYRRSYHTLHLTYAVNDERRIVTVKTLDLMLGSPFADPADS
jgi:hypothetical protein